MEMDSTILNQFRCVHPSVHTDLSRKLTCSRRQYMVTAAVDKRPRTLTRFSQSGEEIGFLYFHISPLIFGGNGSNGEESVLYSIQCLERASSVAERRCRADERRCWCASFPAAISLRTGQCHLIDATHSAMQTHISSLPDMVVDQTQRIFQLVQNIRKRCS